ncbi:MAG: hypothetical protein ACK4QW_09575 [Alphaproteobacteria bacterium]
MAEDVLVTLIVAAAFAGVHLGAPWLSPLFHPDRPWMHSIAGGMAVAFAILILLPELEYVHGSVGNVVYPLMLVGLVGFYTVELAILNAARGPRLMGEGVRASVHLVIAWLYTFGLVYALPEQLHQHGLIVLVTSAAIGLHLAYKDYLLSHHHPTHYRRYGRFFLAASPISGAVAALTIAPSEFVSDAILALIAGYMLQNVFRNEVPEMRGSRPMAFAAGALVTAAPLVVVLHLG